ncbi:hypothetical protein DFH09DRAFT_1286034 [Mycena vulgaris]|nr:hypothetical protein DFH09DRAFT_1286034 [Mycena vulgaris]
MPHPQQHNAVYRRNSFVKGSPAIPSNEELANFNDFLRQQIDLPAEWSSPNASVPWNRELLQSLPALEPRSRPSLPSPEHPNLPSDWWHRDTNLKIVGGPGNLWSGDCIPFFADHGRCNAGISMKMARLGLGMLHAHRHLSDFMRPIVSAIPAPLLSISWPGYQTIEESFHQPHGPQSLNITRPLRLDPNMTLAELAKQVADYFFEFSERFGAHCNPNHPRALLLGPGGINFKRLRMVKLWTTTGGLFWYLEVAIVDDYVQNF